MAKVICDSCGDKINRDTANKCSNCGMIICPDCAKSHWSFDALTCDICAKPPIDEWPLEITFNEE